MLRRTHTRFWRIWAGNSAFSAVNSNPTASIYHNQEFSGLSTHHRLLSSSSGKFDGKIDPVAALMSQIFKVEIPTVSSIEDSKQKSVSIVPDLSYEFPSLVALKYDGRPVLPFPHYCVINVENLEMIKALNALSSSPTPVVAIFFEKKPEFKGVDSADESLQSEKEESIVDMENTESDSGSIENSGTKLNQGSKVQSAQIQGLSVIHSSEFSTLDQVNSVGVMCRVHSISANMFRLMPLRRVIIKRPLIFNPVPIVSVRHATDPPASSYTKDEQFIMKAQVQTLINLLNRARNDPLTIQFVEDANPTLIADTAAFLSGAKAEELQSYLEVLQVPERLSLATKMLNNLVAIKQQSERIQSEIEKAYTEMNVRHWKMQQYKILKRELGFETDDKEAVKKKLQKMLEKKSLPDDVMKVYEEELEKLSKLESNSSEFNVTRNYLEWLSVLPWGMYSPETLDVRKAKETLDAEHYGLEEIKDRILEFIAVGNLLGGAPSGRILCFLGPPGVGKTSIGKSIAKSLNREFYRFSVGGMHDVAEIKGHRRTYVGAMPGKLIQCLKTVDRQNPVIMIDEIDKIGSGIRGDPSSALLEVLDPEQNS